eukprot:1090509-Rhodomonas_salina.2
MPLRHKRRKSKWAGNAKVRNVWSSSKKRIAPSGFLVPGVHGEGGVVRVGVVVVSKHDVARGREPCTAAPSQSHRVSFADWNTTTSVLHCVGAVQGAALCIREIEIGRTSMVKVPSYPLGPPCAQNTSPRIRREGFQRPAQLLKPELPAFARTPQHSGHTQSLAHWHGLVLICTAFARFRFWEARIHWNRTPRPPCRR